MANHQQIAHRWAQMDSKLDVSGYGMQAHGLTVYSWGRHFPIAEWVETSPGKSDQTAVPAMCVLFNANGWSSSTAKHKSIVRNAIRHSAWVFAIPQELWGDHKAALAYFETQALESYRKSVRARTMAEFHRDDAARYLTTAQRYASAFGVRRYVVPVFEELESAAAKRAKAQAAEAKKRAKREQELAEARRQLALADFDAWLRGEEHAVPQEWRSAPDGSAYIRRRGEELQTSQGASVPWEHAVKAFRFIKLCRERGEAFHTNGRTVRVGHFTVDSIDAEGNMLAGCHYFTWSEIERLAKAEGVFEVEASSEAVETAHA